MRFETSVRDMPHMARAVCVSSRGETSMLPSWSLAMTSSTRTCLSSPFGPFTETSWPFTDAVTPFGTATGFLPIRDIDIALRNPVLEHAAQNLATHILGTGARVGHDAFRRRKYGDAKPV